MAICRRGSAETRLERLGHAAGCAVTAGAAVGLDVEEARRRTRGDPLRLAARRFSAAEAAAIQGAVPPCAVLLLPRSSSGEAAGAAANVP